MTDARQLLAEAAARLAVAGVSSPRVDAELLLAAVLGVPRSRLLTVGEVPASAAGTYAEHVARREAREPMQHITGTAPFRHLVLRVGPGVFVPRPETELLVDAVLPHLHSIDEPLVIDLCAGSGALALAIADEVPRARAVAVERSPAAVRWLTRNAAGTTVTIRCGDVRDPELLRPLYGQADVVVANPPYVPLPPTAAPGCVDPEVLADPPEAVFAGADGLEIMPAVLSRAALLLKPGGVLAVEHDDTHAIAVPALLAADAHWSCVTEHHDLAGRPRYTLACRV